MEFRYARHTTELSRIEQFYIQIVGLVNLGGFREHENYDGLFLGFPGKDWHLEFTVSDEKPDHTFDEDDALVFYVKSEDELLKIRERILNTNIGLETPKNPYWVKNGIMISDPDGFKVIFSVRP
ncbi:MAG: VOC family protein [Chitinophagaceae bacterium]|nr:VOC family protein [Chitinophagaceae bacterium]